MGATVGAHAPIPRVAEYVGSVRKAGATLVRQIAQVCLCGCKCYTITDVTTLSWDTHNDGFHNCTYSLTYYTCMLVCHLCFGQHGSKETKVKIVSKSAKSKVLVVTRANKVS